MKTRSGRVTGAAENEKARAFNTEFFVNEEKDARDGLESAQKNVSYYQGYATHYEWKARSAVCAQKLLSIKKRPTKKQIKNVLSDKRLTWYDPKNPDSAQKQLTKYIDDYYEERRERWRHY